MAKLSSFLLLSHLLMVWNTTMITYHFVFIIRLSIYTVFATGGTYIPVIPHITHFNIYNTIELKKRLMLTCLNMNSLY